jgi:hypothetical protein
MESSLASLDTDLQRENELVSSYNTRMLMNYERMERDGLVFTAAHMISQFEHGLRNDLRIAFRCVQASDINPDNFTLDQVLQIAAVTEQAQSSDCIPLRAIRDDATSRQNSPQTWCLDCDDLIISYAWCSYCKSSSQILADCQRLLLRRNELFDSTRLDKFERNSAEFTIR